jgi:hypothetical protein
MEYKDSPGLAVFVMAAALDALWAGYIAAVVKRRAFKAGLLSGALYCLAQAGTYLVMHNPLLILPGAVGAVCGTWAMIKAGGKDGE